MELRLPVLLTNHNIMAGGTESLVEDHGCVSGLCHLLHVEDDPNIVKLVLEVPGHMLKENEQAEPNSYADAVKGCGGVEMISSLCSFGDDQIDRVTKDLLERYWRSGGDGEMGF